jgi:hypothetical protein
MTAASTALLSATPTAAHSVHTPVEIYERCSCEPGDATYPQTHFHADGAGLTCERGLVHLVCAHCCSGANQTCCEDSHDHGPGQPWCPHEQARRP